MFYFCSRLQSLDLTNFNNKAVTDMSEMFYNCSSLKYLNLSNFAFQNIQMEAMFNYCSSLKKLVIPNYFKVDDFINLFGLYNFEKLQVINSSGCDACCFCDWFSCCWSK